MRHEELLALGVFGPKSRIGDRIEMLLRRGRTFSARASMGRVAASAVVLLALLIAASFAPRWIAFAQEPVLAPRFEVSSIKPSTADTRGLDFSTAPGGRVTIANATLKQMIAFAWQVQSFQISSAKGWIDSKRYDVVAKPERKPKDRELHLMLQALLAERFGLRLHSETREMPVYALVVAKPGGKLGPGLTEFKDGSCTEFDLAKAQAPRQPGNLPIVFCGRLLIGRTWIKGAGVPLASFTSTLSRHLGRTVVDESGLTGKYDLYLQWTPDESALAPQSPDAPISPPSGDSPGIFRAMREQLGLSLQSRKGPVEILVIDHAEKPDAN